MKFNISSTPIARAVNIALFTSIGLFGVSHANGMNELNKSKFIEPVAISSSCEQSQNDPEVCVEDWPMAGKTNLVSSAQAAGLYAAANSDELYVEIRNINKKLKFQLHSDDFVSIHPNPDGKICSMALTPSGRFLYLAVCDNEGTSIIAYNTNTNALTLFDYIKQENSEHLLGMVYFQGELFVGTDSGLLRYDASRNAVYESDGSVDSSFIPFDNPVLGLAVDMQDKTLYLTTRDGLHRMPTSGNSPELIHTDLGYSSLAFGQVYGSESSAGLYILYSYDGVRALKWVDVESLRGDEAIEPKLYILLDDLDVLDVSATADGKLMLTNYESVFMMSELHDQRLSYQNWMHDELNNYKKAIFSLVEGGGQIPGTGDVLGKPGFLMRKIEKLDNAANETPIADNVGWALFLLMAIDQIEPDTYIEEVVELLIRTHAGLADGYGGERTVDGHFVRVYDNTGAPNPQNPQPQVYVSMKYLPAAMKAAELYPENSNLQQYSLYLQQLVQRSSDTVKAEQRITWTNDDHGPVPTGAGATNLMSNETWIFGDIAAAQDPYATTDYATYTYDRESFKVDDWLKGEPVISASHAAFIVMGATLILNHHYYSEGWAEQNRNYYGVTMAETDDLGSPYFAAFSAGNHPPCPDPDSGLPCGGYYNDGPSDHPNDILHFPAALGFGQHGYTSPVVGVYKAYRDGRRQQMNNASNSGEPIEMLTRWSNKHDDFVMSSIGIADFWYGAIGLVEAIDPDNDVIQRFRSDFYRPYVKEEGGSLYYSNITPRRVIGIDGDGQRTEYGYQLSPYSLPKLHMTYDVEDHDGDWIILNDQVALLDGRSPRFSNPYFQDGLVGWSTEGSVSVVAGIGANAVQLTGVDSRVSQPLNTPAALEDSAYSISTLIDARQGMGFVRIRWSEFSDNQALILRESRSEVIDGQVQWVTVNTKKPSGANYLHIEFVSTSGEVTFESLAATFRGSDEPIINGDFEYGDQEWTLGLPNDSNGDSKVVYAPDIATAGDNVLQMTLNSASEATTSVRRVFDLSEDSVGTRYLYRFDAFADNADDGYKFAVDIETLDAKGERVVLRRDVGDILPGHAGERTMTIRKRPEEKSHVMIFRMKREEDHTNTEAASVYIDNFRLDKERLFDPSQCVEESPTNCLPSIHQ